MSCSAAGKSTLNDYCEDDNYITAKGKPIPFTTCRKFKGLEADAVILVDVDKDTLIDEAKVFYVGSSRARLYLSVITDLSEDEATECIKSFNSSVKRKDPFGSLSKLLGCSLSNYLIRE